jgi:hypothetical protein
MATQRAENLTVKNVAIAQAAYEAYVTKDLAARRFSPTTFILRAPLDNQSTRP